MAGLLLFSASPQSLAGPRNDHHNQPSARRILRQAVPATVSDAGAQDLIQRMLEAENTLALSGDQVTMVAQGNLDVSSEQQIHRDGANSLRIDYVRPQQLAGDQIIDNGKVYCRYHAATDTLEVSASKINSLRVRVPQVIKQLQSGRLIAQISGQDTVAGHPCAIVQVTVRSAPSAPWRRFWVDPVNGAQLRIQVYGEGGNLQSDSYYTQVSYNPTFDAGVFRIPHAGKKVIASQGINSVLTLDQIRQQIGFPLLEPNYLPEGFKFQSGSVSYYRGQKIAGLRYFNGVTILSLFETPDVSGLPESSAHPRHGVLISRQSGVKIILVGTLADPELQRVLASVR